VEASGFRDAFPKFQKLRVPVIGVSPDKPSAQLKFKAKYSLPFTLLCDVDKKVCEAYGVLKEKNMYGKKVMGIERTTFVIDAAGKIQKIFPKVKAEGHAEEVLAALDGI
jgi:thioredoxin-dependent peroxiredoxin